MKFEKMDEQTVEGIIQKAVQDAVDFVEAEIEEPRIRAQRYYDGEVDIGFEEGRSKVVATKCRDVVRSLKPAIQRVFLSSENVVEFVPRMPEDVEVAEQMTKYANFKFMQNNGYRLLSDVFQDAMVKKCGIAKVAFENKSESEIYTFTGLSDEEFTMLAEPDDIEIIEHTTTMEITMDNEGIEVETPIHDAKVSKLKSKGDVTINSIPPEEFFVDRNARSIDDFFVMGHRSDMTVAEMIALGYSHDDLHGLHGSMATFESEAEFERRNYAIDEDEDESADPASKKIVVTEAYMKVDIEGTGIPQLYQFILGGANYKMLSFELADEVPFAIFECDPEPHAFFGSSLVDLVINDQDAATSMLRGVLDNVALTNNPGLEIVDGQVSVDDLLNNEIGRIVRVKQPNSIREQVVPFTAGSTLPALQYFDTVVDNKTGVSKASQGLDADVLQGASATAIAATMQGAAGQAEVVARNLAEGGMKRLFKLIAGTIIRNGNKEEIIRLNNKFVEVDPTTWNGDLDLMCNVGVGTGQQKEKAAVLRETLAMQMQVWQQYGALNGLVTMTNVRNTLTDMLSAAGINNSDRYYLPVSMESERELLELKKAEAMERQQGQPQQADPNAAYLQGEAMKTQAKTQVDIMKAQMDNKFKMHQLGMQDDLKRDEMIQQLMLRVAEIEGKYAETVDTQLIKSAQDKVRPHNKEMMDGTSGL